MMTIEWKSVDELSDGHGVLLIYLPIEKSVAFVEGYEWFHGTKSHAVVELLKRGSNIFISFNIDGESVINSAKDTITYFLNNKEMQNGNFCNEHFSFWFNA